MRVSIIIPVYNEEKTVGKIIQKLKKLKLPNYLQKEIIVVDDGSTDMTFKIINQFKNIAKIIKHQANLGKGKAIQTALKKSTGEIIIIQDADLEYDPADIPKLLQKFEDKKVNVVYGSRVLGNNQPSHWTFNLGGRLVTLITNMLFNIQITDEPTGYKLFRRATLTKLKLRSKRFEFCPEVTAKIARSKIKIYELPIHYNPRPVSEKKIKWHDGLLAIFYLIKYRFVD